MKYIITFSLLFFALCAIGQDTPVFRPLTADDLPPQEPCKQGWFSETQMQFTEGVSYYKNTAGDTVRITQVGGECKFNDAVKVGCVTEFLYSEKFESWLRPYFSDSNLTWAIDTAKTDTITVDLLCQVNGRLQIIEAQKERRLWPSMFYYSSDTIGGLIPNGEHVVLSSRWLIDVSGCYILSPAESEAK